MARRHRRLTALLLLAAAVSVVHYVDNTVNYADFPTSPDVPAPSRALVALSWFGFTFAGVAGWRLHGQGRIPLSSAFLAAYSVSGLVGIGHYTAAAMLDAPWWRQAHVLGDIACGAAVLLFALRELREARAAAPA